MKSMLAVIVGASIAAAAAAQIRITEWMYDGNGGEFIELTNVGNTAIDMSGWSYDDDSRIPGVFDLSGFGLVQSGQSVILSEVAASQFRTSWSLAATVMILGGYTNNLGRNDEINIFDAMGNVVDRLTYGDQNFPGTIRTQRISGNPMSDLALGANDPFQWALSFTGDAFGSYFNDVGDLGNPGYYIPTPGAAALLGVAGLVAGRRRR